MVNADSILLPPTPKELAVRFQKRVDVFEENFPGVIAETKVWMLTEDFELSATPGYINSHTINAPLFVVTKMARIAMLDHIRFSDGHWEMFYGMAAHLWRQAADRIKAALI